MTLFPHLEIYFYACVSSYLVGLVVALHDGVQGRVELRGRIEEGELDDEQILDDLATELADELAGCLRGSACRVIELLVLAREKARGLPVAIKSSTTTTVCPGAMASA